MRPRSRTLLRLGGGLLAAALVYVGATFFQVLRASFDDDPRPADALVVLGAAQYDGRPSPAYQARLDRALELYEDGLAPIVWVTGGGKPGDRFTEAKAGELYLQRHGVPADALRLEVTSRNSWESLQATARYLDADGVERIVLVSAPSHAYRLRSIAGELGLDASVAATATAHAQALPSLRVLLRETAAVSAGRLIGYRRLANLAESLAVP